MCVSFENILILKMKTLFATFFVFASFPAYSHEYIGERNNQEFYLSQKGYALENKCFRYEYRERYFPGNSISSGYVRSYSEKISLPCNSYNNSYNYYLHNTKSKTVISDYEHTPNCNISNTLGGLIGGGIAASLSKSDAYSWTIPLGTVLGVGLGNSECKDF